MSDMKPVLDALAKLDERQDRMELTLTKNTVSLEEHMRRTALLEEEFKPVKAHVTFLNNAAKAISLLTAAVLTLKQLGLL